MSACQPIACPASERIDGIAQGADTVAIIVAGGVGARFGDPIGKQFVELCGRPIIAWSLLAFDRAPSIAHIVIACAENRREEIDEILGSFPFSTPIGFADPGEVRQESVASGLAAMPKGYAYCAVHDAARPLIETEDIERSIACLRADKTLAGTLVATRVTDTLKLVEGHIVVSTPDRSFYWTAQTPQTFRTRSLEEAHASASLEGFVGTDDAGLVERMGGRIRCIEPVSSNLKVTYPDDLVIAEMIMAARLSGGEAPV